jgi:class 3 adenylate cyclase
MRALAHPVMRGASPLTLAGLALAAVLVAAYAEWMYAANPAAAFALRNSIFHFASILLSDNGTGGEVLYGRLRAILAGFGLVASGLAAWILLRASQALSARLVAWLLLGGSAFTFAMHFLTVDPRYGLTGEAPLAVNLLMMVGLTWLAVLVARFLTVFPRPIDGDSVMATFWARRRTRATGSADDTWARWRKRLHDPDARSRFLLPWHAALVDGRMVWEAPAAVAAAILIGVALGQWLPWSGWGGVGVTVIVVILGWYVLSGLPFAYASTSHLYANGTPEERRRVSWIRALGLAAAVGTGAFTLLILCQVVFLYRHHELALPVAGFMMLVMLLAPIAFVAALAFVVLYRGALDPRLAFTRLTVWSVLGLALTAAFLLIERYVAVKAVAWLSLPPDSGAVMAGAIIAATFTPARRVTERAVTRLAERYMPLTVLAGGARVSKTVLICDLSGYTALSARDEPRALLLGALLKRQGERFASANQGHLVKSMGDAVMVSFPSNAGAARAAKGLHGQFDGAAAAVGVEPLPLHTALHRGEFVESHDGDIYGQTVNVCARLVDAAAAGEIVLSETAIETLEDEFTVDPIGERRFKNVPEPVACYRAVLK